jgi:outer membrane murein-binding lipoprotein Lpp
MSAALFASVKELTARVNALEEKLAAQPQPVLTPDQQHNLANQRNTLRLNLKNAKR